jgi:hypothetical protein
MKTGHPTPVASQTIRRSKYTKTQQTPCPIVYSDLELERTSWRPADKLGCLIREEDMRNKPEWQANNADV